MHAIYLTLFAMSFGAIAPLYAAEFQPAACPDSTQGEIQEDCPWAGIARALSDQAGQGTPIDLKTTLGQAAPNLYRQISRDSYEADLKALWGESINYDELAKGIIVDPAILKALAKTFKVRYISDQISHAGMEHTYGYLFSTLKTAFGYKRARWVHGDTERGFAFPVGTLGPTASKVSGGSLFLNATYFFGRIAFRDEPRSLAVLDRNSKRVSEQVRKFDYSALKPIRLEETIASKDVVLRTDLVPFHVKPENPDANANQYLLVYSVVVQGHPSLITGFPVAQSFVDSTLNKDALGENKPIITRYNAFVSGVSGESFTGTRRVLSFGEK